MTNIYIRDVPRDLTTRLKKIKKYFGTKTWVSFLYEVAHRIEDEIEQEVQVKEAQKREKDQDEEDW